METNSARQTSSNNIPQTRREDNGIEIGSIVHEAD